MYHYNAMYHYNMTAIDGTYNGDPWEIYMPKIMVGVSFITDK